ncbi:MAG: DUF1573 domain-containing protein [Planctomycetota bacterium]
MGTGKVRAVCTAVIWGLALMAPVGAQPAGEPQIVLSQDSWNFGEILHPRTTALDLKLTNAGSGELRIKNPIESSCGCTVAQPGKYVLAPGESTLVKVVYDSKDRQGKVTSHIKIKSNDPRRPEVVFRLSGVIRRIIEQDPFHGASFRVLEPNDFSTQTIKLINTGDQPMKPVLGSFSTDFFQAELQELRAGQEYALKISYTRPIVTRTQLDKIIINTGVEAEPQVEISAYAAVIDRVSVSPPATFVPPNSQKRIERKARVFYFGSAPGFQVLEVACRDPNINLRIGSPEKPPKPKTERRMPTFMVPIMMDLPPANLIPPGGVSVSLFTNDPDYPELRHIITADQNQFREIIRDSKETSQRRSSP